jgi:hypothetical protein
MLSSSAKGIVPQSNFRKFETVIPFILGLAVKRQKSFPPILRSLCILPLCMKRLLQTQFEGIVTMSSSPLPPPPPPPPPSPPVTTTQAARISARAVHLSAPPAPAVPAGNGQQLGSERNVLVYALGTHSQKYSLSGLYIVNR